ncbi:hypothetical protein PV325_008821 [Microctonus aethiopoides]|nr:hypothetical protein PV325_008821 [Microctonus aethiopoides]
MKQQTNAACRDFKELQEKYDEPMGDDKSGIEGLKKVPKIYYGSRTHRQISQVVKELSRTTYAGARMTILSSRDFTCIQNTNRNKTDLCNELLDPIKKLGCPYYNEDNRRLMSYNGLSRISFPNVWDIEDFVKLGHRFDCCPYYAARNLMVEADIIFCPYNYLIDPSIRRSMQIDLKGEIVILDEAHNIEDICRNAASMSFQIAELHEIITDCFNFNKAHEGTSPPYFASVISTFCERLIKFIEITGLVKKDSKSDQMTSKYWTGAQFVELLRINELDVSIDSKYKKAAADGIDHHQKAKEDMRNVIGGTPTFIPSLSPATIRLLENIISSIDMITSAKHANDYRIFIKEIPERFTKRNPSKTWESHKFNDRIRVLELLCMNPGVVFTPLADAARTIALASGTLAPTSSFSSELMTKFPNMLHANHVIPKEQVFVRAISQGPMKIPLRATYANVNSWTFQDELGRVLLDVCETVPYGILCFFSSYTSMKNLTDRWKQNGIMNKIEECKYVMEEPRINSDLGELMADYRQKIRDCSVELSDNNITGVLLFAVFRGKVAEGIDFSDNEARCVLTIGIPYAVMNDPAVELKIIYNDNNSKDKNTLKGREWYTVQAYRALNQALGRCIRHKNDWGAILLVDDRFLDRNNQSYLPNWIKAMWSNRSGQYNLRAELKQFVMERTKADVERNTGST